MITQNEARKIRTKLLDTLTASKIVAKKSGALEFYNSYFYRMNRSAEKWEQQIVAALEAAGYVIEWHKAEDRFAQWPTTSYFVAIIGIKSYPTE